MELPLAVVGSIRQHCPEQRDCRRITDLTQAVEDIDEHEVSAGKEQQAEEQSRQERADYIQLLDTETLHERFGQRDSNDQRHRAEDIEDLRLRLSVEVILEVIRSRDVLNSEHDERHYAYERKHHPRAVLEQILEVLPQMAVLTLGRLYALPGCSECNEEQDYTYQSEDSHQIAEAYDIRRANHGGIVRREFEERLTCRIVRHYGIIHTRSLCAEVIHDIQRKTRDEQLTYVSCHKSIRVQSGTLNRVVGHHCAQRGVRDIHYGVDNAQADEHRQDIADQRVALQIRPEECQESEQRKRHTTEQQERPELAPTGVRAVCPYTYHRIHHGVHHGTQDGYCT